MSEDGTLRSLEPAPPESSVDGSPAEEVGEGLWPWRWGPAWGSLVHPQQRGRHPAESLGRAFPDPPFFIGRGLSPWPSDSSSISLI